ncbi:MAG TPA: tyrosine-type recombinase/integrase, partial [Chloroflexota bacterium]
KRSGLTRITFHGLRHTHATLLLLRGVNAKAVSARLGHAGIQITLDTYAHLLPEMEEQAANAIGEALRSVG